MVTQVQQPDDVCRPIDACRTSIAHVYVPVDVSCRPDLSTHGPVDVSRPDVTDQSALFMDLGRRHVQGVYESRRSVDALL